MISLIEDTVKGNNPKFDQRRDDLKRKRQEAKLQRRSEHKKSKATHNNNNGNDNNNNENDNIINKNNNNNKNKSISNNDNNKKITYKVNLKEKDFIYTDTGHTKLLQLTTWMEDNGVWFYKRKVMLKAGGKYQAGFGYYVEANSNIKVSDKLCKIPKKVVLSVPNSGIAKELNEAMLIGELATALALLYERDRGAESFWFTYLKSLPEYEPLPYFWTNDEREFLKGTDSEKIVAKYPGLLKEDYDTLVKPLLAAHPDKFKPSAFEFEKLLQAMSLVSSRAFNVDSYHGDSMVPLADLFNHKTAAETVHFESDDVCAVCGVVSGCEHEMNEDDDDDDMSGNDDDDTSGHEDDNTAGDDDDSGDDDHDHTSRDDDGNMSGGFGNLSEAKVQHNGHKTGKEADNSGEGNEIDMVAIRPAKKGEEIFNTFGELSNSCLLTKYGFTEIDNPYDTVDLKTSLIISALPTNIMKERFELASKLLKQKVYEVGYNGQVEDNLIKVLRICTLPDSKYQEWKALPKDEQRDAIGDQKTTFLLKGNRGSVIAGAILLALEARAERYPSTLELDEKLMRTIQGITKFALILRVSERRIIERAKQLYSKGPETPQGQLKESAQTKPIVKMAKPEDKNRNQKRFYMSRLVRRSVRKVSKRADMKRIIHDRAMLALARMRARKKEMEAKYGYEMPFPVQYPLSLDGTVRPLVFEERVENSHKMRKTFLPQPARFGTLRVSSILFQRRQDFKRKQVARKAEAEKQKAIERGEEVKPEPVLMDKKKYQKKAQRRKTKA